MSVAWETALPAVQFCLIIAGVILCRYWRQKARDIGRRVPTLGYFHTRVAVRKWLNSKNDGEDCTVVERIKKLLEAGKESKSPDADSINDNS